MAFIALVTLLLLSAFAAHERPKRTSTPSLSCPASSLSAIMLGALALIACVTYSARILGIG